MKGKDFQRGEEVQESDSVPLRVTAPGDADGNGTVDLLDVAYLLNCLGSTDTAGLCGVFDWDGNAIVDPLDALDVLTGLDGPMP